MSDIIKKVSAEEILDSRGTPTLSVTVHTEGGSGRFDVPSGASTGAHEAHELRDGEARYGGKGVQKAIEGIENVISYALVGCDADDQKKVDDILLELDGTPNKTRLGGNAMIGVSIASARAAASAHAVPLVTHLRTLATIHSSRPEPLLFMNLVNGGKHAATRLAFQEYHIVPQTSSALEALEIGTAVQKELRAILREECGGSATGYGDEGGFVPDTDDVRQPLRWMHEAARRAGVSERVRYALDVAASSFFADGTYDIGSETLERDGLRSLYRSLAEEFDVFSIEDPFEEEDFEGFAALAREGGARLVGDDLTVTNAERLERAIAKSAIHAIIVKPNQVGTLSETLGAMRLARESGIDCIVSHRSGETCDDFIADLAVAFGAYGLKSGAPQRGERVAKYNRLAHLLRT